MATSLELRPVFRVLAVLCAAALSHACAPQEPTAPAPSRADLSAPALPPAARQPRHLPPDTQRILVRAPAASKLALKRAVHGASINLEVVR